MWGFQVTPSGEVIKRNALVVLVHQPQEEDLPPKLLKKASRLRKRAAGKGGNSKPVTFWLVEQVENSMNFLSEETERDRQSILASLQSSESLDLVSAFPDSLSPLTHRRIPHLALFLLPRVSLNGSLVLRAWHRMTRNRRSPALRPRLPTMGDSSQRSSEPWRLS